MPCGISARPGGHGQRASQRHAGRGGHQCNSGADDGFVVWRSGHRQGQGRLKIKQSELDEVVLGIKSAAAARNQTIPPEQLTGIESQMLNRLIQIQLLLQKRRMRTKPTGADRPNSK